jgi:Domain of unknown function (DUF4184)
MPHPLAHPAAVLPLKRFCPRWLSLPALVAGSISPDAGYFLGGFGVHEFSHEFIGGFGFCLPVGLLLLWVYGRFSSVVVGRLPGPYQRMLLPACREPIGSPLAVVVSLLIGIWTHQLLDSITHKNGWLAMHSAFLQMPLFEYPLRFRVCHAIWYTLSFAGIVWFGLLYQRWVDGLVPPSMPASDKARVIRAVVLAALLMAVSAAFRIVYHWAAVFVEGALNGAIVFAFLVKTRPRPRAE